jgi:hypothetical protein
LPLTTHYMLVDRAIQHDPQYIEGWAIHAPTRITQSDMLWPLKQVDFGRSSREGGSKRVCQEKRRFGDSTYSQVLVVEGTFENLSHQQHDGGDDGNVDRRVAALVIA